MPVLQDLYIQCAFIKNLLGAEEGVDGRGYLEGFLGGIERCGEGKRQGCQQWGEADRLHGDCIQFLDAIGSALTFENGQLGCTCSTRRALSGKGYMLMIISADQAH